LSDGQWRISDTPFYILPGQTGFVIFFMLTAFLFTRKFLTAGQQKVNWIEIYASRFLRLIPAYCVMLLVLFSLSIFASRLQDANWQDCKITDFLKWMTFTILGAPTLCKFVETNIAVAGVTWFLTYEWIFYFSLPLLALLTGKRPTLSVFIICSSLLILSFNAVPIYGVVYLSFSLGIISAFLDHYYPSQWLQRSRWASLVALGLLVGNSLWHVETSYTITSSLVIALAFHIFASGNTLWGILCTRTFQVFGLCTYSLYLFHGLLLYSSLYGLVQIYPDLHAINAAYWGVIMALTPLLIILSLTLYLFIERPPLQNARALAHWIERKVS
jgi:peptidoglycan/LPS O-acetylase OafA/YrhL